MKKRTQKTKIQPRKNADAAKTLSSFGVTIIAIAGLLAYLWVYTEVDNILSTMEAQQTTVVELGDDIKGLQDNIDFLRRADILTARAQTELNMVYTAPETIAIFVDRSTLHND